MKPPPGEGFLCRTWIFEVSFHYHISLAHHLTDCFTITGYFTSEEGAAQTDYRIIPGRFEGCLVPEPAR